MPHTEAPLPVAVVGWSLPIWQAIPRTLVISQLPKGTAPGISRFTMGPIGTLISQLQVPYPTCTVQIMRAPHRCTISMSVHAKKALAMFNQSALESHQSGPRALWARDWALTLLLARLLQATVRRTFLLAFCLPLMAGGAFATSPIPGATDAVKKLYRDYSSEATMIDWPGHGIADEPAAVLKQYFDNDIVSIWVKSRACTGADCAADWIGYDPLWDSMDPSGFYNVTIEATNDPHVVKVEMSGPCIPGQMCKSEEERRVRLIYYLQPSTNGWRISDIRSEVHGSLKAALRKALNEH